MLSTFTLLQLLFTDSLFKSTHFKFYSRSLEICSIDFSRSREKNSDDASVFIFCMYKKALCLPNQSRGGIFNCNLFVALILALTTEKKRTSWHHSPQPPPILCDSPMLFIEGVKSSMLYYRDALRLYSHCLPGMVFHRSRRVCNWRLPNVLIPHSHPTLMPADGAADDKIN